MDKATKELYLQAASDRIDSKLRELCAVKGLRADAGEVVFTRGQLEATEEVIYEELFSQNLEGLSVIPTRMSFDRGATSMTYYVETKTGNAKLMRDDATDAPLVNASLSSTTRLIAEFGAGYRYTIGEGERGAASGYDLTASKARACARAIAQAINDHGLTGSTDHSVATGFFNDANIPDETANVTDDDWTTVTATGQYSTLVDLVNHVDDNSSSLHKATEVLVSPFIWNLITSTRLADGTAETVLEAFRKNMPGVEVRRMVSLTGQGAAANHDRIIAWERSSAVAEHIIPLMYDEASADKKGFTYTVQARGKSFGTVVRYPLAMAFADIQIA
jgi:hypothetical protein